VEAEGNHQRGEGMAKMGGNGNNDNNKQQLFLYIKSHYMLIFALSPHATEAALRDTNPSNINLIFMDVMC
jgi:hypothetical protein